MLSNSHEESSPVYQWYTCTRNFHKFSDRQAWKNSVNPDQTEQSDQGLHYLQFRLHLYIYN